MIGYLILYGDLVKSVCITVTLASRVETGVSSRDYNSPAPADHIVYTSRRSRLANACRPAGDRVRMRTCYDWDEAVAHDRGWPASVPCRAVVTIRRSDLVGRRQPPHVSVTCYSSHELHGHANATDICCRSRICRIVRIIKNTPESDQSKLREFIMFSCLPYTDNNYFFS